jgi:2-keto-4-pentenoate hydratase
LRAGDRIIAGSLAPPLFVQPGDRVRLELGRLGGVELALGLAAATAPGRRR